MPLHERFDLAATARASFNVYTIPEEIDALAEGSARSSAFSTASPAGPV